MFALGLALRHQRTPLLAQVVIGALVAYVAKPIISTPNVIPDVGPLDKLVVVPV